MERKVLRLKKYNIILYVVFDINCIIYFLKKEKEGKFEYIINLLLCF